MSTPCVRPGLRIEADECRDRRCERDWHFANALRSRNADRRPNYAKLEDMSQDELIQVIVDGMASLPVETRMALLGKPTNTAEE
jgi:hypothetical protein